MKPIDRKPSVETVPEDEGGYNTTPDLHTCATLNEGDRNFVTFVDFASAKMPGPGMSFHISITLLHDYILM